MKYLQILISSLAIIVQPCCNQGLYIEEERKYMLNTDTDGQGEMIEIVKVAGYVYKVTIYYSDKKLVSECVIYDKKYKFKSLKTITLKDGFLLKDYNNSKNLDESNQIKLNVISTIKKREKSYLDSGVLTIDCEDVWSN